MQTVLWTDDIKEKVQEKNSFCNAFSVKFQPTIGVYTQEAKRAAKKAVAVAKADHCDERETT